MKAAVINFMKSGFRAVDLRSHTLRYFEVFGLSGFLKRDAQRLANWSDHLIRLDHRIQKLGGSQKPFTSDELKMFQ